uniref:Uncharacterized protein n=1 Tax=viral metagenome TaxID=1070528 RepID=A0A6M3JNW0_9ZZZZ
MRGSKSKKLRREATLLTAVGMGATIKLKKKRPRLVDVPGSEGRMVDVAANQVLAGIARATYQQLKKGR